MQRWGESLIRPCWWHTFLVSWNGLSLFCSIFLPLPVDLIIQTDATGTWNVVLSFKVMVSMAMANKLGTHLNHG